MTPGAQPAAAMESFLKELDGSLQSIFTQIPLSVYDPSRPAVAGGGAGGQQAAGGAKKKKRGKGGGSARAEDAPAPESARDALAGKLRDKVDGLRAARRADEPANVAKVASRKRKRDEKKGSAGPAQKKKASDAKQGAGQLPAGTQKAVGVHTETESANIGDIDLSCGRKRKRGRGEDASDVEAAEGSRGKSDGRSVARGEKRKLSKASVSESVVSPEEMESRKTAGGGTRDVEIGTSSFLGKEGNNSAPRTVGIEVGSIAGFKEAKASKKDSRRKHVTKLDILETELARVTAKAKSPGDAEDDGDGGETREAEMKKAILRAQGVKVKDQAGKIRKTIRKEKRRKEKSREAWAKRDEAVEAIKVARQEKREQRLKERKDNSKKHSQGKSSKGKQAKSKHKPRK